MSTTPERTVPEAIEEAYNVACEAAEYSGDFNWIWSEMPPEVKAGFVAFAAALEPERVLRQRAERLRWALCALAGEHWTEAELFTTQQLDLMRSETVSALQAVTDADLADDLAATSSTEGREES